MTTGDAIVFVVEDDASLRDALQRLLGSVGLQVETFASAREFLQH
jgi:FixJ family two-component response regulator